MTHPGEKGNMTPDIRLHVRSIHTARWLWIDNTVYDRYAAQLGPDGLGVYVGLARYANNKTGKCWPSMARLAMDMGTDLTTIEAALERIVAAGLLYVTQEPGKGTVLTLLDAQTAIPAAPPVPPVAVPELAVPVHVSHAREDEQVLRTKQEEKKSFVCVVVEGEEDEDAPAPDEYPPCCALNPQATSPYELTAEVREAQSAIGLDGARAALAAIWRTEAVRQAEEVPRPGCLHRRRIANGTKCFTCGEVLEPAAAD